MIRTIRKYNFGCYWLHHIYKPHQIHRFDDQFIFVYHGCNQLKSFVEKKAIKMTLANIFAKFIVDFPSLNVRADWTFFSWHKIEREEEGGRER